MLIEGMGKEVNDDTRAEARALIQQARESLANDPPQIKNFLWSTTFSWQAQVKKIIDRPFNV